jgi:hypothetical protein
MKAVTSIVAFVVLTLGAGSAAARNGGLATWTCIDRPGMGALASNGAACPRQGNPYESAASATERTHAAWLKRYPDEATLEAERQQVLERVRRRPRRTSRKRRQRASTGRSMRS